jgi:lipopolysaccharide/colanic/teichoic acid biosynthesis glycosyltransferase
VNHYFFEANINQFRAYSEISFSPSPGLLRAASVAREVVERTAALVLLLLLSPLMLVSAILVRLSSPGPTLYGQTRVGKKGELFTIYKFRSMVVDAEKNTGPVYSMVHDPRVTRIGKFLRNSHLDELPQLINVLKGEMSFIGPRPERPEFTNQFSAVIPKFRMRTAVKPGITGLAQICGSYELPPEEKLEFDMAYIERRYSLRLNAFILFCTLKKIFFVRYNL